MDLFEATAETPAPSPDTTPNSRSWLSALSKVPEAYRAAMTQYAEAITTQALQKVRQTTGGGRSELERDLVAHGQALSLITYAGFLPYHLITEADQPKAIEVLRQDGPAKLAEWLKPHMQAADTLMVIGDQPVEAGMAKVMAKMLQRKPVNAIVIGPGALMEAALRKWADTQGFPETFLRTLDSSKGETWQASPGPELDASVQLLFQAHRPDRIALLEPVRLPATQAAIEVARHLKIPMESFEPPLIEQPRKVAKS